jgi:secreted Zn-dependent insulinase-like peptidase
MISNEKELHNFHLFEEAKKMSLLSFKYFKVPDPMDNVQALADEMSFTTRPEKLLVDTYGDAIVEEIDYSVIKEVLKHLSDFKNAKVVLSGKNILTK